MKYSFTKKTIAEIGRGTGRVVLVEGRSGAPGRGVTAQLIQVADPTHLWAQSYERNFDDILILQSDVAQAIAKEIDIKLTPREAKRLAGVAVV